MLSHFFGPRSLDALAVRYRTDKSHKVHNFAQFYDRHFAKLREKPLTLLEIGVGRGASIRMWRRYFTNAKLFAVESETRRGRWFLGAKVMVGRQEDREFLKQVAEHTGPLDILIDDGSHRVDDQQITLGAAFPFLKPGGYYILEDIHTSLPGQTIDFGLDEDLSNSTYQMLLNFKQTGKFESRYMLPHEREYLDANVAECEIYSFGDESKHLTSLLRKQ